jgi:hypothetical protein
MKRITFSFSWPISSEDIRELLAYIFQVAAISFFGFYFIEILRPGFVTTFIHINIFLWLAIIFAILTTIWPFFVLEARVKKNPKWRDYLWISFLTLVTVLVIWNKTSSNGRLAIILAPLSGLIVFGLSVLIYLEKEN